MNTSADYRTFTLHGTHAELGHMLGNADEPFARQAWWAPPVTQAFAQECLAVVRDFHPALIDEHAAYADAQSIQSTTLWQACCRVDLRARITTRMAGSAEGCSSFAVKMAEGMVAGRNYDYWHYQRRRQRIVLAGPGIFASAGARGSMPCGRYDGLNERGVFFALHVVMTDAYNEHEIKPGIPFHLVGRIILERCACAYEAAHMIAAMPLLSSLNYLVADANSGFVVETDPRRTRIRSEEDGVVLATNHFRHAEMMPLQGRRISVASCRRYRYISSECAGLTKAGSIAHGVAAAKRILADRSAPVCGRDGALQTLWSCVAVPLARHIEYCPGAPDVTAFAELRIP